jgi:ABC-2 type transport system permease protein
MRACGIAWAVGRRGTKAWITTPTFVAITLLFPLVFLAALAGGLGALYRVPRFNYAPGYTTFVYGFVVLQAVALGGIFTGYSIARDFEIGFMPRLFIASPSRIGLLGGYVIVAVVRSLIAAGVVTAAGLVGGMEVRLTLVGVVGLLGLLVLAAVVATLWSAGVAMRVRRLRAGPLMHTPILLAVFLTPTYVPLALLAGWLKAAATVNPFTYMMQTSRSFLDGSTSQSAVTFGLGIGLAVMMSIWAITGLRAAETAA